MNTPTYKEQFDKLTRAYINDKVYPYDECACFVGNLLNRSKSWASDRYGEAFKGEGKSCGYGITINGYSHYEIILLENCFMKVIWDEIKEKVDKKGCQPIYKNLPNKEKLLFTAFEKTLDLLKQIHISKGENVEGEFEFKKRELILK